MARYGIATLFERYPDGYEFTGANTPLHLTHVDVLTINLESEQFIRLLSDYLSDITGFVILPIADTSYGPNKDIPVTEVELNDNLKDFHNRLINFLYSIDTTFDNPHFLGEFYSPHVSIYGKRRVKIGEPMTIHNVSVGHKRTDIDNPPNRIIKTIPLLRGR